MCNIDKLYDKIIRNSKEAEERYLSISSPKLSFADAGVFLRSLSDETLLKECKARNLDVKYSEETELALTTSDIVLIHSILTGLLNEPDQLILSEDFCKEVLRLFNEKRNE